MKIQEFNIEAKKLTHEQELQTLFTHFLKQYQITHFAFTYYTPETSREKVKYSYASKPYEIWHQHFLEERYEDIDSTMPSVYKNTLPYFWDLEQQLAEAKTPREKQMRQDSIQYGVEKGVSIPIHGPYEEFAIVVLVQMRGQNFLNKWAEVEHEILIACHFYYREIKRILLKTQNQNRDGLSPHQIQCLALTAKQYSVREIAKELGITERTVNFHIQNANKKLATKSKYQSVAKALAKGLL